MYAQGTGIGENARVASEQVTLMTKRQMVAGRVAAGVPLRDPPSRASAAGLHANRPVRNRVLAGKVEDGLAAPDVTFKSCPA